MRKQLPRGPQSNTRLSSPPLGARCPNGLPGRNQAWAGTSLQRLRRAWPCLPASGPPAPPWLMAAPPTSASGLCLCAASLCPPLRTPWLCSGLTGPPPTSHLSHSRRRLLSDRGARDRRTCGGTTLQRVWTVCNMCQPSLPRGLCRSSMQFSLRNRRGPLIWFWPPSGSPPAAQEALS